MGYKHPYAFVNVVPGSRFARKKTLYGCLRLRGHPLNSPFPRLCRKVGVDYISDIQSTHVFVCLGLGSSQVYHRNPFLWLARVGFKRESCPNGLSQL